MLQNQFRLRHVFFPTTYPIQTPQKWGRVYSSVFLFITTYHAFHILFEFTSSWLSQKYATEVCAQVSAQFFACNSSVYAAM